MLQIPLSADTEALLRARAEARGAEIATLAAELLHDALTVPSVEELLAPFREQVARSGVSPEQFDELCEELRNEVWQAR